MYYKTWLKSLIFWFSEDHPEAAVLATRQIDLKGN